MRVVTEWFKDTTSKPYSLKMHSFFLTLTTFLLIISAIAYIILSSPTRVDDSNAVVSSTRMALSWSLVAFSLMLVVGINATCTFEKTVPRAIYIVLFLVVLYNAVVDQFMDGKVLGLGSGVKSKLVGGTLLLLVVFALHRTSVWMRCNARLRHVRDQYSAFLDQYDNSPEEIPKGQITMDGDDDDTRALSHDDKVEIAERIIESLNLGERATGRMLRQRDKESRRVKKSSRAYGESRGGGRNGDGDGDGDGDAEERVFSRGRAGVL